MRDKDFRQKVIDILDEKAPMCNLCGDDLECAYVLLNRQLIINGTRKEDTIKTCLSCIEKLIPYIDWQKVSKAHQIKFFRTKMEVFIDLENTELVEWLT